MPQHRFRKNQFMKQIIFALAIAASASGYAQKQQVFNDKNAETRTVGHFHAIEVSDGIDVYLENGDEAVAVSASQQKFRDKIKTTVEDGVLKIIYKNDVGHILLHEDRKLKAYISYKQLNEITASTGCDIKSNGTIKSQSLSLKVSAGSDFKGKVDVGELRISQQSGSDIELEGNATTVVIEGSSGSDFRGYKLFSDIARVDISGGSDVEITVNKELSAKASGASDINYRGNPSVKESNTSGASSISRKS